ncbi:MAG: PAS domain-containing protein [Flavobacteriales bacterium]|nr:PAS domain-containing protein [Flavobacteriales bacterium]
MVEPIIKGVGELSDENYKVILNNMGDPVFVKDSQSRIVLVNDAFCKLFGRERVEIIGKTLAEDVPQDERDHFLKIDRQVLSDGKESIIEESLTIRGAGTRIISTRKTRFIDETSNKFLVVVIRDLTERKQAEELYRSNKYKQFLLSVARILSQPDKNYGTSLQELTKVVSLYFGAVCDISILNDQTQVIVPEAVYHPSTEVVQILNELFNSRIVRKGEGLVGSVIDKGEEVFINEVPEDMKVGPRSVDERIAPRSLLYRPIKGAKKTLGSLNLTRLVGQDSFTENEVGQIRQLADHVSLFVENAFLHETRKQEVEYRKRTEFKLERLTEILKKSEADTLNMLNAIPVYIGRVSKDLRFTFLNDAFGKVGINQRALEGKFLKEVMGIEHIKNQQEYFSHVLNGESVTYDYDGMMQDNVHRYFNISMTPDFAEDGTVVGFFVSASDVTQKIAQGRKLKESEERLRLIFENVEDYIGTVNEDGVFESINRTAQGLTEDDVVGTSIYEFYNDTNKVELLRKNFTELKKSGNSFELEDEYTGPDGSTEWYTRKFIAIFRDDAFFKAVVIIRDITAERNEERAIMSAVLKGQEQERKRLGAELHDGIGQILSAISLNVSQVKENINLKDKKEVLDELYVLDLKIQTVIKEVRTISHGLMPEVLESFGLKEAIRQVCDGLQNNVGIIVRFDHVDMEERYDSSIEVSLYRITQELLNNIQKHASCSNVFVSLMDYGETLNLSIEDDGIGFEQKTETNGIGLKNVASRVKMLGGEIDIESAENSGSLINIEIPKSQK